jgi:cysteine desulfurase / selenocysteine lyase
MSTGDRPPFLGIDTSDPAASSGGGALALGREIERLANQLLTGLPAGASPGGAGGLPGPTSPVAMAPLSPVGPAVPPNPGPNALAMGAGGASPALTAPPIPGPIKQPPLAVAPPPKESDLRAIPTMLSDQLGLPSVFSLASAQDSAGGQPYFLEIAGLPGGVSPRAPITASPSLPSSAASPGPAWPATPPSLPSSAASPSFPAITTPPTHASPSSSTSPSAMPASPPAATYDFRPELVPGLTSTGRLVDGHVVKKDFPILQQRVRGRRLVWLDNAATTQKPQVVIDRLSHYYEHENSNVHRAAHTLAARATDAYEGARETVRRFLNAPSAQEIVFVRGTTEAINLVAKSWGHRYVGKGDEIVITWLEHHANIVPWQQLAAENEATLRVAPVDSRGQVKLDEYEKLLGPRTRIVAFSQVSNALGTIVPAREMIQMAHRHGALALLDGAQSVSHMRVDVQALDCDFFCFSGHKIFAPMGIGVLYGKRSVLESMPPWQGGGNMIADVTFEKTTYQAPPSRFEAGTNSIGDAVGLGAALDYVSALGIENVSRYEHELLVYGIERLARVPGLTMVGTAADKAGVLSFVVDGLRTEDLGAALDQEGIAVRSGHHCAQPILRRFGLESTVRASLAPYNTYEDIDALVAALLRLTGSRQPTSRGVGDPRPTT